MYFFYLFFVWLLVFQKQSLTSLVTTDDELRKALFNLEHFLVCKDQPFESTSVLSNKYWILRNYIKAGHGPMNCSSNVTYTTHADYRYLDNLIPLLERWRAPVSLALYAPGWDFDATLESILWLLKCHKQRDLVRELTSFHIYFKMEDLPMTVPRGEEALEMQLNCLKKPPFQIDEESQLYRFTKKLNYPVNIGRNLARGAALTHYVLASDIELYPSPGLVPAFLEMLSRTMYAPGIYPKWPVVFALRLFEIERNRKVPNTKREIQDLLFSGHAIPFHHNLCPQCHTGPRLEDWINSNDSDKLNVFNVGKRIKENWTWEPIFIGTVNDPTYDERLSWEGMSDKMTQGYALCALNYEFHILDNAFLVHKPGIKSSSRDSARSELAAKTYFYIRRSILKELRIIYGSGDGCGI